MKFQISFIRRIILEILSIFLIGISLSMDAFSFSLCYGTLSLEKNKIYMLSLIVGLYHFFMPLVGMLFGHILGDYISINLRYVVFIIFIVLGIEMINSVLKNKQNIIFLNNFGMLLFGFSVSIDSFSAGIGVELISDKRILCSTVFSLTSTIFTFVGLKLGGQLNKRIKDLAPLIGGGILITLAFLYVFK